MQITDQAELQRLADEVTAGTRTTLWFDPDKCRFTWTSKRGLPLSKMDAVDAFAKALCGPGSRVFPDIGKHLGVNMATCDPNDAAAWRAELGIRT